MDRRLPVGAEVLEAGVHFRVWAPHCRRVEAVFEPYGRDRSATVELEREGDCSYFSGLAETARAGLQYRFRLDGDRQRLFPDPASRFQPEGPLGPSQIVDPRAFAWTDADWPGITPAGQVLYELHVGAFTPEGTWREARQQLAELAATGVTLVQMMPVADFVGRFGWGYDGVNLFAPTRLYGSPDELRAFIDAAHALGLGVLLDVVYNHVGSSGNFLTEFSPDYASQRHPNEWGQSMNFDGPNSGPVREFVIANAAYWIDEFHFDGLRFDATQAVLDDSADPILAAIGRAARRAAGSRSIVLTGENEPQNVQFLAARDRSGAALDALYSDDFHHAALVRLNGRRDGYYHDYFGAPEEFIALAKSGFLYQGQYYSWQKAPRGTPTDGIPAHAFVNCLENHDQLANSADGRRTWQMTSPGRHRAMTAYLLLTPGTPMLFQGQEFSASSPFLYFADPPPEQAASVIEGRKSFLKQFRSLSPAEVQNRLPDPTDYDSFRRSKLDFAERSTHAASYALHRDLLRLRRDDPLFRRQDAQSLQGRRLSGESFVLRYFGHELGDRLLLVNFGPELQMESMPEPLLAPPLGERWRLAWSSEDLAYGGAGVPPLRASKGWIITGESAVVLTSRA
jgi:maltooligosyltrehalose trehalohydrolase